jgi:hypothetical protein
VSNLRIVNQSLRFGHGEKWTGRVHERHQLTSRVSPDEERVNGARARNNRDRAPRHWLNPLVGMSMTRDGSWTEVSRT